MKQKLSYLTLTIGIFSLLVSLFYTTNQNTNLTKSNDEIQKEISLLSEKAEILDSNIIKISEEIKQEEVNYIQFMDSQVLLLEETFANKDYTNAIILSTQIMQTFEDLPQIEEVQKIMDESQAMLVQEQQKIAEEKAAQEKVAQEKAAQEKAAQEQQANELSQYSEDFNPKLAGWSTYGTSSLDTLLSDIRKGNVIKWGGQYWASPKLTNSIKNERIVYEHDISVDS